MPRDDIYGPFTGDSKADLQARKLLDAEAKAVAFDIAIDKVRKAGKVDDRLARLEAIAKKLDAATARPIALEAKLTEAPKPKASARVAKPVEALFGGLTAETKRFVKSTDIDRTLAELFPGDMGRYQRRAAKDFIKGTTVGATTTNVNFGGTLADTVQRGWIEELQHTSVIANVGAQDIPFGNNNAITMPRRAGKGHVSGSFVGETSTIPVKQDAYGSVTVNRFKAAVISTMSAEIAAVSTPDLQRILRQHVIEDTSIMLDSVFLDPANAAIAGVRPASPWNGATNQPSAGTDLSAILTDVAFLISTIMQAGRLGQPKIIMDPQRHLRLMMTRDGDSWTFRAMLEQGSLFGIPVIVSATCPTDTIYSIDARDCALWLPTPEIDTSDQALLVMIDDDGVAPTMTATNAVDPAGSVHVSDAADVTGGPAAVKSLYQTRLLALRLIQPVSWAMLRDGSTSYVTSVQW